MIGSLQREHLRTRLTGDHQGVHFASADGGEGCLRLGEARAEAGEFADRI